MWPFKKEELAFSKVTIHKIPQKEIPIFLKKYDETYSTPSMVAIFEFWGYIYRLFPEMDKTKNWEIAFQNFERIELLNTTRGYKEGGKE